MNEYIFSHTIFRITNLVFIVLIGTGRAYQIGRYRTPRLGDRRKEEERRGRRGGLLLVYVAFMVKMLILAAHVASFNFTVPFGHHFNHIIFE